VHGLGETTWELPEGHHVTALPETGPPLAPAAAAAAAAASGVSGAAASISAPDSASAASPYSYATAVASSLSFPAAAAAVPAPTHLDGGSSGAPDQAEPQQQFQARRAAEAAAALPNLAARAAFASAIAKGQPPAGAAREAAKAATNASAKPKATVDGAQASTSRVEDPAAAAAWAQTLQARAAADATTTGGGDGREGAALHPFSNLVADASATSAVADGSNGQGKAGDKEASSHTSPLNVWQECIDPTSGQPYYFHAKRGLTQWTPPAEWLAHTVQAALPMTSSSSSSFSGKRNKREAKPTTRTHEDRGVLASSFYF